MRDISRKPSSRLSLPRPKLLSKLNIHKNSGSDKSVEATSNMPASYSTSDIIHDEPEEYVSDSKEDLGAPEMPYLAGGSEPCSTCPPSPYYQADDEDSAIVDDDVLHLDQGGHSSSMDDSNEFGDAQKRQRRSIFPHTPPNEGLNAIQSPYSRPVVSTAHVKVKPALGTSPQPSMPPSPHDSSCDENYVEPSQPARTSTPSQFVFNKPKYGHQYHATHFHHQGLEKKKSHDLFVEVKRFFKSPSHPTHYNDTHAPRPRTASHTKHYSPPSTPPTPSCLSPSNSERVTFANRFNGDISGRYGQWGKVVGKGAGGSVRIIRRSDNQTFAVKQFRKRNTQKESEKEYAKKITAEFCIGSTLHHNNIIETLDIVQEGQYFYEIMEYCPNDVFDLVMSGQMSLPEIYCVWKQVCLGVKYLHDAGIAHRDLKLDNLVMDPLGCIKIIDFGCAVVFRYPHEDPSVIEMAVGVTGSEPYIAPEMYTDPDYDPRLTDIWSLGIVLVCMIMRRFPWKTPQPAIDKSYKAYIAGDRPGLKQLLDLIPPETHELVQGCLDTSLKTRYGVRSILRNSFVESIHVCSPDEHQGLETEQGLPPAPHHTHHIQVAPAGWSKQRCNLAGLIIVNTEAASNVIPAMAPAIHGSNVTSPNISPPHSSAPSRAPSPPVYSGLVQGVSPKEANALANACAPSVPVASPELHRAVQV
ncbi:hypothetical protein BZG36_04782 [Bifiguratus adelaidae]|uniref:Protein kinase domain-containing protein n=1 Tax=Bifiguratus adelaidae TaxID=1938954 RepID=A0A261XWC8_9FUNG|nr:hypothetical protein BZG36_04782 [Bifiguratus adelaidae]